MKRKIIKQGSGGLTIYLPKKWADQKGICNGDEVDVKEKPDGLFIIPEKIKKEKRNLTIKVKKTRESALRTVLVNAYRAGFDNILLEYDGEKKEVNTIVQTFLLGCDVFQNQEGKYSIENMSEPAIENFENILIKQLYLLEEVLANVLIKDIVDETHKIQKYDHFLKRCLSKEVYTDPGKFFISQFLSHITQTARLCLHFQKQLGLCQKKIENDRFLEEIFQTIRGMSLFLKRAYLKQDVSFLREMHEADERILKKKDQLLNGKNTMIAHQLLLIERSLYLTNSPLMGLLHIRSFQPKS